MSLRAGFLLAALTAGTARAAAVSDLKVSGLVYAQYEAVVSRSLANGTPANDRSAFDINRVYLNFGAPIDERFSSFVQLEANLLSRDDTANQVYLKQALLEWKEIYPGAKVMFGLVPMPWRGLEESVWRHRFVSRIMEDQEGLLSATDRGVRLTGTVPRVTYDLVVSNGEGTGGRSSASNDADKYKDYAAKVAYSPFLDGALTGLKLNAQLHKGNKIARWPRDRVLAGASFESARFNAFAAYMASRDGAAVVGGTGTVRGQGFTTHGSVFLTKKTWLFARCDFWDANTALSADGHFRVIAGVGYTPADQVRFSADYQAVLQEKQAAARRDQAVAGVHVEVKF